MEPVNVGVKVGGGFVSNLSLGVPSALVSEVDYIEYAAPVLAFDEIMGSRVSTPTILRPHSVFLSTANASGPPQSVLRLLARECEATRCKYIGEHIGYLNPSGHGPSLGYIFPPPLNRTTVENVTANVREIQDACGIPAALENPAFYTCPTGTIWDWGQFVSALSDSLPESTGWLIDVAHLKISAHNLGLKSIKPWLEIYAATRRKVFEVHLASVRKSSERIWHDDHRSGIADGWLAESIGELAAVGLLPENFTLECDKVEERNAPLIIDDLRCLRALVCDPIHPLEDLDGVGEPAPEPAAARTAEARGRIRILRDRIQSQLRMVGDERLTSIARIFGFPTFDALVSDFCRDPGADHFSSAIPFFSDFEPDGVDLTGPLYEYLRRKAGDDTGRQNSIRQILAEIAVQAVAGWSVRHATEQISSVLDVCGAFDWGKAGRYQLKVDKDRGISIIRLGQNEFPSCSKFHIQEGSGKWMKICK